MYNIYICIYIISLSIYIYNLPAMQETQIQSLVGEDSLEKGMAINSSILAWRIPCTEEPSRLQFMGLQRVRYNWVTNIFPLILCVCVCIYKHIYIKIKKASKCTQDFIQQQGRSDNHWLNFKRYSKAEIKLFYDNVFTTVLFQLLVQMAPFFSTWANETHWKPDSPDIQISFNMSSSHFTPHTQLITEL